jgi:adenosine deaminase
MPKQDVKEPFTIPDVVDRSPKAELHCHCDGVVDPAMLRTLGTFEGEFESLARALENAYPVNSMTRWLDGYDPVLSKFLSPLAARLRLVAVAQLERWRRQNVQYAELFVSGILGAVHDVGALMEWFRTLHAELNASPGSPRVNLVVCLSRKKLAVHASRILELAKAGQITGVALAGDELECSVRELGELLHRMRDQGLGIEIHAGETGGPDSVCDALDFGSPDRIGHAVRAFEEPALVQRIVNAGVHVEFCPTSNLRLGVVRAIDQLPLRHALAAGVEFSINTDDPGVFQCSLTSELRLVQEVFGLEDSDLERIFHSSVRAAFDS